jgi:hypothetical protein
MRSLKLTAEGSTAGAAPAKLWSLGKNYQEQVETLDLVCQHEFGIHISDP